MKKLHFLQCFDVTDAVNDGIEDFNRLSGNPCKTKKEAANQVVQKLNKPSKILLVAVLATFVKLFK